MKKLIFAALLLSSVVEAQTYRADWESLDTRPTPSWWKDAKFGIFIHWGVYAVPGWSPKGTYAEWYQQGLQTTDTARQRFHKSKFGDKSYYQLADDFKAELYKPDEWAKLFEKSGAKYIVLTSKHHDGFTLWPNKEANKTWGFPWNAKDIGPKRDLLGDLFTAVRKTSVRAGMYYSLYEWFNPLWLSDKPAYVENHMWPQLKELINTYQPDVLWTDGEWDAPAETWKSQQFLAWLFNESVVKDKIVVNDRWGSGIRFKHAGFFTPEYQPDLDFENHDWEESRGMGHSYGYNREEDSWDYNSTQSLIIALIDKVSRGGNFLLDIGPDEHGKIPPIMQERLLEIGDWLQVNGEAIYNTRRWKTPVQWSEGKRGFKMPARHDADDWETTHDIMLKLTVDPDPGYAVKEIFFTYNPANNSVYAIFPKYPSGKKLVINDMSLPAGANVQLLGSKKAVSWKQEGTNTVIELPEYDPAEMKTPQAFAVRISGYGKFAEKPSIQYSRAKPTMLQPTVTISGAPGAVIRYTTDGSEPSGSSSAYTAPFVLQNKGTVKAKSFVPGILPSGTAAEDINVYRWMAPTRPGSALQPGWSYAIFELKATSVEHLANHEPVKSGTTSKIDISPLTRKEQVGMRLEGFIKIDKDDVYTFYLASDDGSRLKIGDEVVIDHDGLHGNDEKQGSVALKNGYHRVVLEFFQATGGIDLKLKYSSSTIKKQDLPAGILFSAAK
jgi:alpha-L-fucosidase